MRGFVPIGLLVATLMGGCPEPDPVEPPTPAGCGDGVIAEPEDCDDGEANSDSAADACRLDCTLPACGDDVVDSGEDCDDGGAWGADGCSPTCRTESGRLEAEPNDDAAAAEPLAEAEVVIGALPEGDVDCFAIEQTVGGWLQADVAGEDEGSCPAGVVLSLFDPAGSMLAQSTPATDGGCSPMDPVHHPGARFMDAGTWTLCAAGHLGGPVPQYRLSVELGDDTCSLPGLPFTTDDDPDGDGVPDVCDSDDDGDGVPDGEDDCPASPNGGDELYLAVDEQGFVRDWLLAGPYTEHPTTDTCRASEDNILEGDDDSEAVAALGDWAGEGLAWFVFRSTNRRIRFLNVMAGPTHREVYAATWVWSDSEQPAIAALGPDDGARVWINGVEVLDIVSCQGTNVDQFQADVTLREGWNRVLVKVRDQGGGWAMFFRFLDPDGAALTDLGVSLSGGEVWAPDQGDLDGDGTGDVCDTTPLGDAAEGK